MKTPLDGPWSVRHTGALAVVLVAVSLPFLYLLNLMHDGRLTRDERACEAFLEHPHAVRELRLTGCYLDTETALVGTSEVSILGQTSGGETGQFLVGLAPAPSAHPPRIVLISRDNDLRERVLASPERFLGPMNLDGAVGDGSRFEEITGVAREVAASRGGYVPNFGYLIQDDGFVSLATYACVGGWALALVLALIVTVVIYRSRRRAAAMT